VNRSTAADEPDMRRILLAEDDKSFGLVLKNELEDDGYAVDLVCNGVEAVLTLIGNPEGYALTILDVKMPGLDGIDALRIIKKLTPDLPAIAVSGNAGSADLAAALNAGALHCLAKPFGMAAIKELIRGILNGAK
jgi:CheY-like chemotaxis protein